jgi:hypothetical protein
MAAIVETLEADVRSSFQTKKVMDGHKSGYHFDIPFDGVLVRYEWTQERLIEITDVLHMREGAEAAAKGILAADEREEKEGEGEVAGGQQLKQTEDSPTC